MATMITSDCINCGACEPECPNNAISQGPEIYVIDPLLCTECVGFHDYEACAAVCPVDCCVTDPNNIETEDVLIARAKELHKDVQFGDGFESRFRKKDSTEAVASESAASQKPQEKAPPASKRETKPREPVDEPKSEPSSATEGAKTPAAPAKGKEPEPKKEAPKPEAKPKPKKEFPGELPVSFQELAQRFVEKGPFGGALARILVLLSQPLLGALPHSVKAQLEAAVGHRAFFSASGATGFNILLNMILYPVVLVILAAVVRGTDVVFTQEINPFILLGFVLGLGEALYRLKEGIFEAKSPDEMILRGSFYGIPLAKGVKLLMERRSGLLRKVPIPVDGFYEKGFVEKLERERRYGNVYTLEDLGSAYFLRLQLPKQVPDIGLPVRAELPDVMPDYDYDLLLRDGHFIVKGWCPDEKVKSLCGNVGAFPSGFTTVIPLKEKIRGFSHRCENKVIEVFLLKEN